MSGVQIFFDEEEDWMPEQHINDLQQWLYMQYRLKHSVPAAAAKAGFSPPHGLSKCLQARRWSSLISNAGSTIPSR